MCGRRPRKLPPIISAQGLSKRYGVAPLFQNISFTVSERDRIGVIGPNGSGKSTLLEMLIGSVKPDSGDVAIRKGTRLSYVAQISEFAAGVTIRSVIEKALERSAVPETGRATRGRERQRVAGGERRVPACAEKKAGVARESRAHGTRMAAPWAQGASHQGQGAHR